MSSLLRSTKFVRYFTGAARTLILNSAKTAEANSLLNPKAICSANSILLRDYATAKKENLEPLLQRLDLEVRKFGRITKRDIDEVFDEIRGKNDITSSQSLLVIRCCGQLVPEELPEQRTLLVQKIWNILSERGVPMDISHYNALLRVYIENEHNFSPAAFLEELEKKGIQPNRVTYQRLMWRYCQEGDMDGALNVLEKMRELGMPVSEPVLNALVMGHSFQGDTEGAKVVMQTMASAGLQPTNRTYTMLACGYARQGDIDAVNEVITKAKDQDILLTDKDLLETVEHLAVNGFEDKVEEIFPHLHKSTGYNQDVCNAIFRLLNKGCEITAKKVMKTMPKGDNANDTMFKGAFYVKHLMKCNLTPEKLIQQCRDLQKEGLVPGALYIATEIALQTGQSELAQMLFKELQKDGMEIRQHYYWPLLAQKGKENDEEGLLQILRNMNKEGILPTGEALRDYVIPYIMDKESPQNVIVKLQIANIPAVFSARTLIIGLLESGDIKKAASIALEYKPRGQYAMFTRPLLSALSKTKDVESFATILHVISNNPSISQTDEDTSKDEVQAEDRSDINGLSRLVVMGVKTLNNPDLCTELLNVMLTKGLRISTSQAEEIEQFLNTNMTTEISDILSKLTSSELERTPLEYRRRKPGQANSRELEHLLAIDRGEKNVNNIKKQLILAYMKEKQTEKLNLYLQELKASNFEITLSTLTQLFEYYCDNDDIAKAEEIKAEILARNPEFTFTKFKKILMAYALIRANKYDEAKQYLLENKSENDVGTPNFFVNSKSWQMINYLAEQKEDVKVRELTKLLIDNNYVEPSNILLGPSIKAHILKDDIEGALNEFEYCCKQYRCTPWKGELMKSLIMKEDATKLQWLADLSTQIHGEVNILHDLVLAFVECGRLKQARRILETPGLHTRQKRLESACERYVEEGKSEYLEGLLEATKELSHIDRSNMYYHLLVTYCASNETDKALGLWTILQEEGEIPSDKFLIHLGQHLRAKNREIPFVMPELPVSVRVKETEKHPLKAEKQPKPALPTKAEVSDKIEELVKAGDPAKAMDFAIKCLEDGVTPRSNVLKFALKQLAAEGNVEKIQALGKYINEKMRRDVTYDDKLTLATFNRGAGKQHVDGVFTAVNSAETEEDLQEALKKFPRGLALSAVVQDKEMLDKCHKIAEIAASKGQPMPANLLWMEYILRDLTKEADALWNSCLTNAEIVVFRRLLQESHTQRKPELIEKLINVLHTNTLISPASIGNAYSRLINYYLTENDIEKAQATLHKAIENGISKEHFNKTTIQRLLSASETAGKKLNLLSRV